jgi:asparagine synthase (glutamine-hydrolysing)
VTVYNGEIYNFHDLTEELLAKGHKFRTRCDTEVVVHAWEEWGEACVERFRGMFAFAVWDRNRECLFLARDRLGIKPMHYALLGDGQLVFASELKALLVHPNVQREMDPTAIEDYFAYGYVPDPKTIFRDVLKLEPGHTLMVQRSKSLRPRQYWDIPFERNSLNNETEARDGLLDKMEESVRIRMIAEVPLGAFLSGGVDSSAVVALMAENSAEPVKTCSIAFGNPQFNESQYATEVARTYRTDHHIEEVTSDDYDLIDVLSEVYDEPYADSSAIPTYRVCQLARKWVTVALSGDGGDENFAGYRRYRWHMLEEKLRSAVPGPLRRGLFGLLGNIYPKIDWAPSIFRAKSTFQAIARDSIEGYFHNFSVLPDALRYSLYSRSLKTELQGYRGIEVFQRYLNAAPEHPLSRVQYIDFKTYLPGDILTKVDRASMAHSLEVRVPILDHKFVEWVAGIGPDLKLRSRQGKYIFKQALKPHLSDDILFRPKMGFAVPLASWFRGPLRQRVRDSLLGPILGDTDLFEQHSLAQLVDQHEAGDRDHSAALWALLMFEAFVRRQLMSDHNEFRLTDAHGIAAGS